MERIQPTVSIATMSHAQCEAMLRRNHFGRIAFTFHDKVSIEPISYVWDKGWMYGRTSQGSKWLTLLHHPWVAFEIDEVESEFHWKSVVVHGTVAFLQETGSSSHRLLYATAIAKIRQRSPFALMPDDPTPQRDKVFGISIDEISGKACTSSESQFTG